MRTHNFFRTHAGQGSLQFNRSFVQRSLIVFLVFLLCAPVLQAKPHAIGLSFTGTQFGSGSSFIPPDTMGGVGINHIVELINGRFRVYDKATGAILASRTLNQFWTDAGVAFSGFVFDPRVVYDPASGRWFAASVDNSSAPNSFLLAVSASSDPTGAWNGFSIDSDPTNTFWADFPTLGLDADGVYLAANMFPISGTIPRIEILSLPKADLLVASPTVANATLFSDLNVFTTGWTIQPVVDFGPSDGRGALLAVDLGSGSILKRADILDAAVPLSGAATLTGSVDISVPGFLFPPDAAQPGPKTKLDTGDHRFGSNVVEVGDRLWAVHTIDVGGRPAIQWFEIEETTNALLQSGIISDNALGFYYPSVAVNTFEDVVIGFSGSGVSQFVSAYAAIGETVGGSTTFGTPILLQAGVNDYEILDGTRNRWGDYSATVPDPVDSMRFWTFQEWVSGNNQWAIQVTEIILSAPTNPDCDGDGDVDGNDFLTFSNCFNGSLNPPISGCPTLCADLDADGDVDGNDFLTFSNCFNGSLNPPACP